LNKKDEDRTTQNSDTKIKTIQKNCFLQNFNDEAFEKISSDQHLMIK
jgi:hypothetical protein